MAAGQQYNVDITVQNTGTDTWSEVDRIRLGGVGNNAGVAALFGPARLYIPSGTTVGPGQSYTFSFAMTAPLTTGSYTPQYRMLKEGVKWFGETLSHPIEVVDWESRYSIVHISDTQKLSESYPSTLNFTFSYLESIKEEYNITGIIITGDLVNDGSNSTQWVNYASARSLTEIPLYEIAGNHDIQSGYSNFDTYIGTGKRNWTADINDFLFIGLGYTTYGLSESDVNFYNNLIVTNPPQIPLFATHYYFRETTYPSTLSLIGTNIEENLIIKDPTFVMCGHMHGNILHSGDKNGRTLIEDMTNYQTYGDYMAGKLYSVHKISDEIITITVRDSTIYPSQTFGPEIVVYQNPDLSIT